MCVSNWTFECWIGKVNLFDFQVKYTGEKSPHIFALQLVHWLQFCITVHILQIPAAAALAWALIIGWWIKHWRHERWGRGQGDTGSCDPIHIQGDIASIMMRGANNQQLGGHKTFVFLFIHVSRLKYQNYIPMFHKLIWILNNVSIPICKWLWFILENVISNYLTNKNV